MTFGVSTTVSMATCSLHLGASWLYSLAHLLHPGAAYSSYYNQNTALGDLIVRLEDRVIRYFHTSCRHGIIPCITSCN